MTIQDQIRALSQGCRPANAALEAAADTIARLTAERDEALATLREMRAGPQKEGAR